MTFTEHLGELRSRIIYSGIALVVSFVLCYCLKGVIFECVAGPLRDQEGVEWLTLTPIEAFLVQLKLAAYAGVALALPFIVYQLCAFVFPGLRANERRAAMILLTGGTVLVIAGVAVAYFGTLPLVLPYIMKMAPPDVLTRLGMKDTVSLLIKFYVGFAAAFQFPMVVLVLVYMDLLSPATLRAYRRFAVVGIAALSALFTPPDPISMIMMALPLVFLYELSIWMSYLVARRRDKARARAAVKKPRGKRADPAPSRSAASQRAESTAQAKKESAVDSQEGGD